MCFKCMNRACKKLRRNFAELYILWCRYFEKDTIFVTKHGIVLNNKKK